MSVGQGYADWQRTSQWEGAPFLNADSQVWTSQVTFGPFYVATWEGLMIVGGPASGLAQLLLSWSVDQAGNQVTAQTTYNFSLGAKAYDVVANAGVWLYATILPGNVAPAAGPLRLIPRQGVSRVPITPAFNRLLEVPSTNVAAAANFVTTAGVITSGPAVLAIYCSGNPWLASLYYQDNVGGTRNIWWGQNPANQNVGSFQVSLPTGAVNLYLQNNAAGSLNFQATIHMYR